LSTVSLISQYKHAGRNAYKGRRPKVNKRMPRKTNT
jgi:hypothetical protein